MSVEKCEDICVNYNGCEWYSWRHGGDPNNPVEAFCILFEANGYTQTDKNYITNKKGNCISSLTDLYTPSLHTLPRSGVDQGVATRYVPRCCN